MNSIHRLPTYYLSHGGGPWAYMEGSMREAHAELESFLKSLPSQLNQTPKAILMISAHWETKDFTLMASPNPSMVYDYYGFPDHTYHVQYSAPGSPALAKHVQELLTSSGIACQLDLTRGFDHGAFVPLAVSFPEAQIPVVQLSILASFDPAQHFKAGEALSVLRDEGILILGSGSSYHNLRYFDPSDPRTQKASAEFDNWLNHAVCEAHPAKRKQVLENWSLAPSARYAHAREDHLVPLFVALGSAVDEKAERVYHEKFMGGIMMSSFKFGA